jgi:hypothetical protein
MANALYDAGREGFLKGEISWSSDDIKVILVDTASYTVDLANHTHVDDVPGAARTAVSSNLGSKTTFNGVADAGNVTFTSVTGNTSEALVIYKDDGVSESSSPLIAYIDDATNLPITPNGGNIIVAWSSGVNRIFKL